MRLGAQTTNTTADRAITRDSEERRLGQRLTHHGEVVRQATRLEMSTCLLYQRLSSFRESTEVALYYLPHFTLLGLDKQFLKDIKCSFNVLLSVCPRIS